MLRNGVISMKYRIITFDGGGIRGVLTAALLVRLENLCPGLVSAADLFAGTSTGSFIALGLAYGLPPEKIVELYSERNGKYIFEQKQVELFRPKYDPGRLRELLNKVFPEDLRLKDLSRHVLVPSFRVSGGCQGSWGPVFYSNFPGSPSGNEFVIDVALASSAAPVYFPSFREQVDGGVVANNPGIAAVSMARDVYAGKIKMEDIYLLSIGTGYSAHRINADTREWGAFEWALYPSPPFPLLSMLFDGAMELGAYITSRLLRGNYCRLNPSLPRPVALDDYRKITWLESLARKACIRPVLDWIKHNWF